jgi:hypothetical protein
MKERRSGRREKLMFESVSKECGWCVCSMGECEGVERVRGRVRERVTDRASDGLCSKAGGCEGKRQSAVCP